MSTPTKKKKSLFYIHFYFLGKVISLYARNVRASTDLYNMCIISNIVFKTSPNILVPSDEELKKEFSALKRLLVPLNSILRIDEMDDFDEDQITDPREIKTNLNQNNLVRPVEFFSR